MTTGLPVVKSKTFGRHKFRTSTFVAHKRNFMKIEKSCLIEGKLLGKKIKPECGRNLRM